MRNLIAKPDNGSSQAMPWMRRLSTTKGKLAFLPLLLISMKEDLNFFYAEGHLVSRTLNFSVSNDSLLTLLDEAQFFVILSYKKYLERWPVCLFPRLRSSLVVTSSCFCSYRWSSDRRVKSRIERESTKRLIEGLTLLKFSWIFR